MIHRSVSVCSSVETAPCGRCTVWRSSCPDSSRRARTKSIRTIRDGAAFGGRSGRGREPGSGSAAMNPSGDVNLWDDVQGCLIRRGAAALPGVQGTPRNRAWSAGALLGRLGAGGDEAEDLLGRVDVEGGQHGAGGEGERAGLGEGAG